MKKIPQSFQNIFWSVDVENLDLEKDKVYIINQALSHGGLEELRWLFKTYSRKVIRNVFLNQPIKTYRAPSFNFVKKVLLDIKETLPEERYVINTPRIIR